MIFIMCVGVFMFDVFWFVRMYSVFLFVFLSFIVSMASVFLIKLLFVFNLMCFIVEFVLLNDFLIWYMYEM